MEQEKPTTVQEFASMGGRARAKVLTKKERQEIGRKGAQARWGKKKESSTKAKKNA